jgi:uncharacterized membrane protein
LVRIVPLRTRMTGRPSDQVLVHFYRAVVMHMDVWRQRMDATTNWAAATAAGMITFTFSTAAAPHYLLLIALVFQLVFLLMESRRYQTFDLWRRRFRTLNRAYIVPALDATQPLESGTSELQALARDMGRTVPHLSLLHALGYRVRRNYGYLIAVTLVAWLMKLEVQPDTAGSAAALAGRARIAFVPGGLVMLAVFGAVGALLLTAATAPTHDMVDWEATTPRWRRWRATDRKEDA